MAHDARLGAFVTVTEEQARAAAARVDVRRGNGDRSRPALGGPDRDQGPQLDRGDPDELGSAIAKGFVPSVDDHVVTLLAGAGLVSLGKTNTPEFGLPCYPSRRWRRLHEPVRPLLLGGRLERRGRGGGGGGAGGPRPGERRAGSIRIPASACGLVGLKPPPGAASSGGPLSADPLGLRVNGPLARTVRDAAALLDVMAVPMPGDPWWAPPLAEGDSFLAAVGRPTGRLRIGRYARPVIAEVAVEGVCLEAYDRASSLLEESGTSSRTASPPLPAGSSRARGALGGGGCGGAGPARLRGPAAAPHALAPGPRAPPSAGSSCSRPRSPSSSRPERRSSPRAATTPSSPRPWPGRPFRWGASATTPIPLRTSSPRSASPPSPPPTTSPVSRRSPSPCTGPTTGSRSGCSSSGARPARRSCSPSPANSRRPRPGGGTGRAAGEPSRPPRDSRGVRLSARLRLGNRLASGSDI